MIRKRIRLVFGLAVMAVGLVGVAGISASGVVEAQGLPLCGGNQTIRPAPINCTNTRTIDGTEVTVVLNVTAAGVATSTFTLGSPRVTDTPIRVRWHEGISSGPLADEIAGVIPAGSVGPVSLSLTVNTTCGGQIDNKAIFVANGDTRGRVGAPYVGLSFCNQTTTTAASTTVATTVPPTTGPVTSVSPVTTSPATVARTQVLPGTGGPNPKPALLVGLLALAAGAVIVVAGRRTTNQRETR